MESFTPKIGGPRNGAGTNPLGARLQARRLALEQAILARVRGIEGPAAEEQYGDRLGEAVPAAVEYGLTAIEVGRESDPPPIPPQLLVQARLAARSGVSLDTVLRRYCAGNTLFSDVLIEAAEEAGLSREELKRCYRVLAMSFENLIAVISEEYVREAESLAGSSELRRVETLRRMLAGELVDTSPFKYDFEAHHLGVVASGSGAREALRALGERLDRSLLIAQPDERTCWGWLGGRVRFDLPELEVVADLPLPDRIAAACGEPSRGFDGWRQTHLQAVAALGVAERRGGRPVRYADVALLTAVLKDDLTLASLSGLYLEPLRQERDRGESSKETLRAYFAARGNVSSAAAALGVNRRTVSNRLAAIEEILGRPVDTASAEIETALQLDEIAGGGEPEPPKILPLRQKSFRFR
jgi:hypothetical protein